MPGAALGSGDRDEADTPGADDVVGKDKQMFKSNRLQPRQGHGPDCCCKKRDSFSLERVRDGFIRRVTCEQGFKR